MDGLLKYGGSGDFQLKMAKEGSNVVWNVTIDNPRLMELLGIFVGEKTIKLVQSIDPNNLDPNQKIALDAIKSLSQKLEFAQKHPVWDSLKLSGAVVHQGTNWLLQTKDDSFKLTGDKLASLFENPATGSTGHWPVPSGDPPDGTGEANITNGHTGSRHTIALVPVGGSTTGAGGSPAPPIFQTPAERFKNWNGRVVVADGFVKVPGEFEVTRFLAKRENTLELFVMSFCPFGQKAEAKLLAFLASTNATAKPRLDVHYIFYKQQKDGKDVFVSLHGEDEVVEDLVEMALRDHYPQFFQTYLQLRASNGSTPWKKLISQVGLRPSDEAEIEKLITTQREQMIRSEYDYAAGRYEITDGSPSYVWESERVPDLKKIAAFKGLDEINVETCSH